jgi:hypothetical protein
VRQEESRGSGWLPSSSVIVVVVIVIVQVCHGDVHVQYEIFFARQNEPQTIFLFGWTDRRFAYVWQ